MLINPAAWFRKFALFPRGPQYARMVLADYATIGAAHKHFLSDLADRAGVYRAHNAQHDGTLEAFNGRRELALEIINLARQDAQTLFDLVPEAPRGGAKP